VKHLTFALLLTTPSAFAADVPALMNQLVGLRAELETANRELETDLKQKQSELDLWTQKKLELEGQVQKESMRKMQLDEKIARLEARVRREGKQNPQALPQFNKWLEQAQSWVESSLPFRHEQRLATLHTLKERAARGLESLEGLTSELWLFLETEMKMAGDNEFRITDAPGGKAEVARLGFFAMITKTSDDKLQRAVFRDGKWTMDTLSGSDRESAVRLISNMKSKKDSGLYQLPLEGGKEQL
jgi:predicted RNase H-like nuclease (RuvC/YqgF family)